MPFLGRIKQIGRLKLDLFANFAGVGWSALVQLACIPLYIKFLGIEAYGLIGFYLVLTAMVQVLDLGLSGTMFREMARYSVQPEKAAEARDLVRTLEAGYWFIGIAIGAVIFAAAPLIAADWIKAGPIPVRDVEHTLMLMGVLTAIQWPLTLYQGGLLGLGRQVLCNGLNISMSTLSNGGAVLILWRVSPTIQAFFLWLIAVNAVRALLVAVFLWKSLPPATRSARFEMVQVRNIWRFAAGMSGITICCLILTQSDKVILSRLLSLKLFGYYTLAGRFGVALTMIITAVWNTMFPRFSALVAEGNEESLTRLYHYFNQLLAVLILPFTCVVALFSTEILQLWTRNSEIAHNAGPIASLLVAGTALNGLTNLPYALQLAHGWTSIGLRINILNTVMLVPAIWILALHYGPVGAASVWIAVNGIYLAIAVPLTHRRFLKGEARRWLGEISLPLVPVLLIAGIGRGLVTASMSPPVEICTLLALFSCTTVAAALVSPMLRSWLLTQVWRAKILR